MQQLVLVQPQPRGRISGGYLYNARMEEAGMWRLAEMSADALPGLAAQLPAGQAVVMDSIWLRPEHLPSFLALKARGHRLGLMLHSFPSMVEATENGRPPLERPTAFEVDAIDQLDFVMVPGQHYRDLLGPTRTPIIVAEPGIDEAWRAEPRRRQGACRLVSVGAVTPRKGFLDVVEILERRSANGHSDVVWSVVGSLDVDPAYASRVQTRAAQLAGVTLAGQLSPNETRRAVQQADILLMPSYDENQPLVLLEAMAASVPAVAYAAGATRRMLEHACDGFVTAIGDKSAFEEHLNHLVSDEPARYAMAVSCWERQRSIASWPARAQGALAELNGFSAPRA